MVKVDINGFVISKGDDFAPNTTNINSIDMTHMYACLGENLVVFQSCHHNEILPYVILANPMTGKRIRIDLPIEGMVKCINCHKLFDGNMDWKKDVRAEVSRQADALGMESLTEREQMLFEEDSPICSEECYDSMS